MVRLNGERIKLYDNNKLTIVDAAMQAGFPNEDLFPKRGAEINFSVNGVKRVARGEAGESAEIKMNDKPVGINTPLEPNSDIVITRSTRGADAVITVGQLDEYRDSKIAFQVNGKRITCPRFVEVNGKLESEHYEIKNGDSVDTRAFYTVRQLMEFMDVEVDDEKEILVNNRLADADTLVYENFTVEWKTIDYATAPEGEEAENVSAGEVKDMLVYVNDKPVTLQGKTEYVFVDVFDFYDFDLGKSNGRAIITQVNGKNTEFSAGLKDGDRIRLDWKENEL